MSDPKHTETTIAVYETALHWMIDEYEALETKFNAVKGRLDALMSRVRRLVTLGILQMICAHDTSLGANLRIRAAGLAVPFERPKLSVTATASVPLFDLLEARRPKSKTIEHHPSPSAASSP